MSDTLLDSLLAASVPDAATDALRRAGLPTSRDEAWKYTNLKPLAQRPFRNGDPAAATRTLAIGHRHLSEIDGTRLVFVNGVFRADASQLVGDSGVDIVADAPFAADAQQATSAHEATGDSRAQAFANLNEALLEHHCRISVAAGARASQRIHLVFVGASVDVATAIQLRVVIELGAGATLDVVEHHLAGDDNDGGDALFANGVLDVAVGQGATLTLTQLQFAAPTATLIRRSRFEVGADASVCLTTTDLGARMMRHDIDVALGDRGARLSARGVFAIGGRQHADTHLTVTHAARDTRCDIVARGVADGRARGVFHGAITVVAGADGAKAKLRSDNLLLSPDAEIDTQPVLEIHADEVEAAHGATIGRLDETALFYLRSRGIDRDSAQRILIGAFCDAVLGGIEPADLREHVSAELAARVSVAPAS